MVPDQFLADYADPRPWSVTDGELPLAAEEGPPGSIVPDLLVLGQGDSALEVATSSPRSPPRPAPKASAATTPATSARS